MTTFEVPGKPQGKARARTFYNSKLGHMQSITPEKTVLYENLIKSCYMHSDNRESWFEGQPLDMNIIAYFEVPKSTTKKDKELIANGMKFPTKKPDADNIAKCICDALNGIAYKDDTQIVRLNIIKDYTFESPCVVVQISEFK